MTKWTKAEAIAWLKEHDFKSSDYDHMPNWHSFRQTDPGKYKRFTNTSPASGVMFILGWRTVDGEEKSEVQSVRFYHGEADSQAASTGAEGLKDLVLYKDTWTHQRMPTAMMLKDVDRKKGIVQAYASAFDVVDDMNEVVRPGAFERTIEQRGPEGSKRVAFLRQHRPDFLLGKPSTLEERELGLFFEAKISQTSYGKDTLILYEDRVINEHSIGYDVVRKEVIENGPTELLELRLWDVSAVVWGANEHTPFVGLKSIEQVNKAMNEAEAINRALGREITDDTAIGLEYYLRQLQQGMIDFLKAAGTISPDRSTPIPPQGASLSEIKAAMQAQSQSMQAYLNKH